MLRSLSQRPLRQDQLRQFGHDLFVEDQVRDFAAICPVTSGNVVDLGGGRGYFARALADRFPGIRTHVIDSDATAVGLCIASGIEAHQADILRYIPTEGEQVACLNLVLHHLVGNDEAETRELQLAALRNWRRPGAILFVNEYVYESRFRDAAGGAIFTVTSNRALSAVARMAGLRANTYGTGVRFRSRAAWLVIFQEAGFVLAGVTRGHRENVAWPLRPLVRSIRRDSFVLQAA